MERITVHIGLPKTGSTTLQETLFSYHPDIKYIGQTNIWKSEESKLVLKALLLDKHKNKAVEILKSYNKSNQKIVISDEAISLGEFMQRGSLWGIKTDHMINAERINKIIDNARILIVLRKQDDWFESWFKQGLKTGKYLSNTFQNWFNNELSGDERQHLMSLLNYHQLVDAYTYYFGEEYVHIYFYEDYKDKFHLLARDIASNMGIDTEKAELLTRKQLRNVTKKQYQGSAIFLKKIASTHSGRKIVPLLPERIIKENIRRIFKRQYNYPEMNRNEKIDIMSNFNVSNKKLFKRIGRSNNHGYYT